MRGRAPALALAWIVLAAACRAGFGDYQPSEPATPGPDPFADDDDTGSSDADDSTGGVDDDSTADDDDSSPALYEGDEPGECSDGADNDQDGLYDCNDPNCEGAPDCEEGDDDDATTPPDDDDDATTPPPDDDDDDATPSPTAPNITNVVWSWLPASGEFEFDIYVFDSDCNLGSPTIYWSVDGTWQSPAAVGGTVTCNGTIYFYVGGFSSGASHTFQFQVQDSVGQTSNVWTVAVTAS
jgi:hypothetical protein